MKHRSKNKGAANGRFIPRGFDGEKRCRECKTMQSIGNFVIDKSRFDGRGYVCANCRTARRKMPGPSIRERRAKLANDLKWCRGCETWHPAANISQGACRSCLNRFARLHYVDDEDFRKRRRIRTIARRRGVDPIPLDARENILEEFDGRCAYCSAPATTWDHVVPVVKGGLTEPYNMVPACGRCNSSKRTQNVWTWIEKTNRSPHSQLLERLSLYDASMIPPNGPDPFD